MAKQEKTGAEIFESAEALQKEIGKAEGFLKNNQKLLSIIGGGILAIVLGIVGYNYWTTTQDEEAQAAMFNSVYAFETDSLNLALKGTSPVTGGLLKVAEDFGSTDAGNLAQFYSGVALMKQAKYDDAIEHLKAFSSSDFLIQGRAYCLIGDAYMEKKNTEEAISYYKKAADYNPNKFFTPTYMMKLATAYETAKDNKSAFGVYDELIEKYPDSGESSNAKKFKAKLEGTVGE